VIFLLIQIFTTVNNIPRHLILMISFRYQDMPCLRSNDLENKLIYIRYEVFIYPPKHISGSAACVNCCK